MDNEDVIREQMEDTRTALTEKLEILEQQVSSTVQGATTNVAETVEAVKETVEAVKDTVQDTVASVKESVEETISTVKETVHDGWSAVKEMVDIPGLVESHPWAMFGGSVALGFILEGFFLTPARPGGTVMGKQSPVVPPDHYSGEAFVAAKRPAPSMLSEVVKTFEPEIKQLKGLALGVLLSSLRDAVVRAAPENMAGKLAEIFDSVSEKMGADTFAGAPRETRPGATTRATAAGPKPLAETCKSVLGAARRHDWRLGSAFGPNVIQAIVAPAPSLPVLGGRGLSSSLLEECRSFPYVDSRVLRPNLLPA